MTRRTPFENEHPEIYETIHAKVPRRHAQIARGTCAVPRHLCDRFQIFPFSNGVPCAAHDIGVKVASLSMFGSVTCHGEDDSAACRRSLHGDDDSLDSSGAVSSFLNQRESSLCTRHVANGPLSDFGTESFQHY